MKSIKGTKTEYNVMLAFIGESQARVRYEFFAKNAKKDGFITVSKALAEISDQEKSHAKSFFKLLEGSELTLEGTYKMGGLQSTEENLKFAIGIEKDEHDNIYPEFADVARDEGLEEIAVLFSSIANAEGYHLARLQELALMVESGDFLKSGEPIRWVCSKCGFVHTGEKPLRKCPACQHSHKYFEVDNTKHDKGFVSPEASEMNNEQYVRACETKALKDDRPFVLSVMAKKVGVFKRSDGSVYAIELVCKHQGADLSKGEIKDGVVICQRHGWSYSLKNGKCLSHPDDLPLRHHDVKIEEGTVHVSLMPSSKKKNY